MRTRFSASTFEPDQLAHTADLPLAAFAQHDAQLVFVGPARLRGLQRAAVELEAVAQQRQRIRQANRRSGCTRTRYSFSMTIDSPINRFATRPSCVQHEQAGRIDVETARRRETAQMRRAGSGRRQPVFTPAVGRGDQRHGRRVAVLGLTADIADRLVQQDRHALRLRASSPPHRCRCDRLPHTLAEHRRLAVDAHPAGGDPGVGFAS